MSSLSYRQALQCGGIFIMHTWDLNDLSYTYTDCLPHDAFLLTLCVLSSLLQDIKMLSSLVLRSWYNSFRVQQHRTPRCIKWLISHSDVAPSYDYYYNKAERNYCTMCLRRFLVHSLPRLRLSRWIPCDNIFFGKNSPSNVANVHKSVRVHVLHFTRNCFSVTKTSHCIVKLHLSYFMT